MSVSCQWHQNVTSSSWDQFGLSFCGRKPFSTRAILVLWNCVDGAGIHNRVVALGEYLVPGASLHISKLEFLPYIYFTPQIKVDGVIFSQVSSDNWIHGWASEILLSDPFFSSLPLQDSSIPSAPQNSPFKGAMGGNVNPCRNCEKQVQPFLH